MKKKIENKMFITYKYSILFQEKWWRFGEKEKTN